MAQRIIILGAGRFGTYLASKLSEYGCEVVLADHNDDRVKELAEDGFHTFEMDVEDEDALKELGVADAVAVVVSIGENMQGSILATLALKELKAKKIIARAQDAKHGQVLEKVGADLVVLPSRDMAYRLAERLRDDAGNERQLLSGEYQLAQVHVGRKLDGQTLLGAKLPQNYNITVVLVIRPDGEDKTKVFEPGPELALAANDTLMVVGKRENINHFEDDCGVKD
ncbi:MAG TPA: TrkA family potassium uptake protein [Candidatus Aquilonibacter sp.]|nr:TrkA family potassium uptake protein [Candidatus Aquilonibacter sp.]